jgi:hypothetical protein
VSAIVYLEGGGDSKELHARCRKGFRELLEKSGFRGRMPKLVACGRRLAVYDDFGIEHSKSNEACYVGMLIDSEVPVTDVNATWEHLRQHENWAKPGGANNDQVLFMTTCMESWIIADRRALAEHYERLQVSAFPDLVDLEGRERERIQGALVHGTRNCSNAYAKGKRSFEILAKLDPATLEQHLPSFVRVRRILGQML